MDQFIKDKMEMIYDDFKQSLENEEKLCFLRGMFRDEDIQETVAIDYTKKVVQQLYLLRYMPAYITEYYMLYLEVLRHFSVSDSNDKIKILSLGSGCGIDYWGLIFAIKELFDIDTRTEEGQRWFEEKIIYKGIDLQKWLYQDSIVTTNFEILEKDISNVSSTDLADYNILVFPKSLCELSDEVLGSFLEQLNITQFKANKLFIITSMIKSSFDKETERLDKIWDVLKGKQYMWSGSSKLQFQEVDGEYPGIRKYCSKFIYPEECRRFLKSLNRNCKQVSCIDSNKCSQDLNRCPILKAKYITSEILMFKNYDKSLKLNI